MDEAAGPLAGHRSRKLDLWSCYSSWRDPGWLQGTPGVARPPRPQGAGLRGRPAAPGAAVPKTPSGGQAPGGPQWHAAATRGRCWPQAAGGQGPGDAHPGAPLRPPQSPEGPTGAKARGPGGRFTSPRLPGVYTRVPPAQPAGTPVGPPTPPSSVKPPAGLS